MSGGWRTVWASSIELSSSRARVGEEIAGSSGQPFARIAAAWPRLITLVPCRVAQTTSRPRISRPAVLHTTACASALCTFQHANTHCWRVYARGLSMRKLVGCLGLNPRVQPYSPITLRVHHRSVRPQSGIQVRVAESVSLHARRYRYHQQLPIIIDRDDFQES